MLNTLLIAARTLGPALGASATFAATVAAPGVPVIAGGVIAGILLTGGIVCLATYLLTRPDMHNPTLLLVVQHAEMAEGVEEKGQHDEDIHGTPKIDWPTADQIEHAIITTGYSQGTFHFAVAGASGSGKSSLINAFRGLRNKDTEKEAAPTGTIETTITIGRYPDPSDLPPRQWTVWYDIPGAGTQSIPDWQYFNQQGLFIFDAIIVVFNDRFTLIDLGILRNCKALGIPSFIVRTKADIHIHNSLEDNYNSIDGEGQCYSEKDRLKCREEFVKETKKAVAAELEKAGLDPEQKVYIVSKEKLRAVVCAVTQGLNRPIGLLDEEDLYVHLLTAATMRRCDIEQ